MDNFFTFRVSCPSPEVGWMLNVDEGKVTGRYREKVDGGRWGRSEVKRGLEGGGCEGGRALGMGVSKAGGSL